MPNAHLLLSPPPVLRRITRGTAFGCPRDFLDNQLVYVVISPRARGLSIGVNMNPDGQCNFDCAYCEVNRCHSPADRRVDVDVVAGELQHTLDLVRSGEIKQRSCFNTVPDELLKLRHVALSGDGEPTLCPNFTEAVQTLMYVRARSDSFFKVVLITNSTGLDRAEVQAGLKYFTREDEIWAKLDAGTQAYMNKVNGPGALLDNVMANILFLSRRRPVIIQSLFPSINEQEPARQGNSAITPNF